MDFNLIYLDAPHESALHLSLSLTKIEYKDIFEIICTEIISKLVNENIDKHNEILKNIISKWKNYFNKNGFSYLSDIQKQGIIGELKWIDTNLEKGRPRRDVFSSWKGVERGVYDFQSNGDAIEVKTTLGKEPRKIVLN